METQKVFKYNFTFLYQSMVVYATTLALYLVVRGMMHNDFSKVLYDPVVYLLCIIILVSALAVIYNIVMHRRIEVGGNVLRLKSALRELLIDRKSIRSVRVSIEQRKGFIAKARVITIFTNDRRRPIRIRHYNFERSEELYQAIKHWAGDALLVRKTRLRNPRSPRS